MTDRWVDPTGKRALFTAPVENTPDTTVPGASTRGRTALFSTAPRRPGTVVVECSDCKVRSRITLVGLAVRFATGSLWYPLGRYPHWVRCPACGARHWCRVGWWQ
jgi:hypothetical protein